MQLAARLRVENKTWPEVSAIFADRYRVNMRVAFRLARGWSQGDVADEWCRRWPADRKTFKNISYWELWPASTGHAPLHSLVTMDLRINASVITGTWRERPSPTGYYKGAEYYGAIQLLLDPTGRSMDGKWAGFDMANKVNTGPWQLTRVATSTSKNTIRSYRFKV